MKLEILADLVGGDKDVRAGEVTDKFTGAEAVRLIQAGYARAAAVAVDAVVSEIPAPDLATVDPDPKPRAARRGA